VDTDADGEFDGGGRKLYSELERKGGSEDWNGL
jgi:hypothetical protein